MLSRRRLIATSLALTLALVSSACGEGQDDLRSRAVRAVAAIPSVVRAVAPNADPKVLEIVDAGVAAFNAFASDPTPPKWRKAVRTWDDHVKGRLLAFNDQRLSSIVAVVDILLTQVVVPELPAGDAVGDAAPVKVETKFKESDVKRLEALIKQ